MEKRKLTVLIISIVAAVLVGNIALGLFLQSKKQEQSTFVVAATPTTAITANDELSYTGEEGVDALTLLKQQVTVEQDQSGLVVSINGRKADSPKQEYWAFYVNGKLAPVGPAEYKTKEGDKVEWKIETY